MRTGMAISLRVSDGVAAFGQVYRLVFRSDGTICQWTH